MEAVMQGADVKVRRHGFTLVELLVAIGIVALLMTIAVAAYRGLTNSGKVNQTRVTINALQGMMAALDREAGFRIVDPFNPKSLKYRSPYQLPDMKAIDATEDASARAGKVTGVVERELVVMQALTRIPDNKKTLQQLPSQFVKTPGGLGADPPKLIQAVREQISAVDAWGRFLIFAPAEGVTELTVAKVKLDVFKAPDGRPFIISAGPDGDFRTGDDNIYSFQQQ